MPKSQDIENFYYTKIKRKSFSIIRTRLGNQKLVKTSELLDKNVVSCDLAQKFTYQVNLESKSQQIVDWYYTSKNSVADVSRNFNIPKLFIICFFLGKVLIYFSAGFTRGVDYDVSCTPEGIHVTSSSSSFVLTDKSLPKNKAECKEISHWNSYGGSIFVPSCLNIQENDKFWSDIFPSRAVTEKITKIFRIFLSS